MEAHRREITIVGGGLAGLSLGMALRREGIPVLLHEAGSYPRHRVCGEFISGLGQLTRERLGLTEILQSAVEHGTTSWFVGEREILKARLPEPALGISRFHLDDHLQAAFQALGGILQTQSRVAVPQVGEGLVWAAGRQARKRSPWLGLKAHFLGVPMTSGLEMHLGRRSYVGLTPIGGGRVNVCALLRGPMEKGSGGVGGFLETLRHRGLAALAGRLAASRVDAVSFTGVSAMVFGKASNGDGELCIGDAHCLIPPFTGNGMTMAFQSAEAVIPALEAYAKGEVEWGEAMTGAREALKARFRRRVCTASLLHPFLTHPMGQQVLAASARFKALPFGALYHAVR